MEVSTTDRRVNVLAADDNPNNLAVVEAVLKDLPVELYRAGSGAEAIHHVLHHDFAVILLDLRMSDMDGFETARRIRQRPRSQHTPLLFITATKTTAAEVLEGYRLGAVDYLIKPVEPEVLRAKVQVFVELARQRQQLEEQAARLRQAEQANRKLNEDLVAQLAERRRAEATVRLYADNQRTIFEHAADGIFIADPSGAFVDVNSSGCAMMGYRRDELLARTIEDIIAEEERPRLAPVIARLLAGEAVKSDWLYQRKDGTRFPGEVSAAMLPDGRLIGIVRDLSERKRAEAVIRLFAEIVESIPIGLLILRLDDPEDDRSLRIIDVNPSASVLLGFDVRAMRGKTLVETFPAAPPALLSMYAGVVRTGTATELEDLQYGDERVKPSYWSVKAFPLPDDRVGLAFENISARKQAEDTIRGLNEDLERRVEERTGQLHAMNESLVQQITERRLAEESLKRSEERMRMAIAGANLGTWHWDIPTGELVWSDRCLGMFGLPPGTPMSYEKFLAVLHPDDRAGADAAVHRALQDRTDYDIELRSCWPDGTVHWAVSRGHGVYDDAGRPVRMEGVALDITERKQAETLLRENDRRLRGILDSLSAFVGLLTLDGILVEVNRAPVERAGLRRDDLIGKPFADAFWWSHSPAVQAQLKDALQRAARGERVRYDVPVRMAGGQLITIDFSVVPLFDADGQVVQLVPSAVDITERVRANEGLQRRTREQSVVANLGQRALVELSLPDLFDQAVAAVASCLDVEYCKVLELLPGGDALLLRAGVGWNEGLVGVATVAVDTCSQAGYAVLADGPVVVEDLAADNRFDGPSQLVDHGVVSGLSVRIHGPERPFGVLGVHTRRRRDFTADEVNFVTAVANVLANAIAAEHARTDLEHRVAERTQQLHQAQQELEQFFNVSLTPLCIAGVDGFFKRLNPAWTSMLGWSAQELLAAPYLEFVHPEDRDATVREAAQITRTQVIVDFENRYRCKDGSYRSIVWNAAFVPEQSLVYAFAQDITEKKRLSEQLVRARAEAERAAVRLQAILDSTIDGIITIDEQGVVQSFNPAAERLFGYASAAVLGQNLKVLMPPPYRDHHDGYLAAYLQTGVRKIIGTGREVAGRRQDGSTFPIALSVTEVRLSNGRLFTGILRDITDAKQAEAALRERVTLAQLSGAVGVALTRSVPLSEMLQECAQALVDHLGAAFARVWTLNEADGVLELQASAGLYTHRDGPHARVPVGRYKIGLIAQERTPHLTNAVVGDPRVGDQAWAKREGMVAFAGYPLLLSDRLVGVMAMFARQPLNDATLNALAAISNGVALGVARHQAGEALLEAKREADRANRAKSEFLSRMSHELRTPLNAILGFGQLLARSPLPPRDQGRVEQVVRAGKHLLGLINEVLDLARIEAGRVTLSPEPIAVAALFTEVLDLVRPLADKEGVYLDQTPAPPGCHVLADNQKLKQVLMNLLANAIKYNRPGGRVTLAAAAAAGRVRLSVRDTGAGLSPAQQAHLFEPFNRLGAEATSVEGTGLGLVLSRRLVGLMQGALTVASRVGEGSTFVVDLPTADPAGPGPLRPSSHFDLALAARPRTVLYVEDNLANLSLVEDLLADYPQLRLLTAMQGGLGLDLARQHRPDLILLDVHLPDIHGDEFLRRLRSDPQAADTPVVVLSADATARQIERFRALGVDDYLTKPIDVAQFLRILEVRLSGTED